MQKPHPAWIDPGRAGRPSGPAAGQPVSAARYPGGVLVREAAGLAGRGEEREALVVLAVAGPDLEGVPLHERALAALLLLPPQTSSQTDECVADTGSRLIELPLRAQTYQNWSSGLPNTGDSQLSPSTRMPGA